MCKKLACLILFAWVLGSSAAQAARVEWMRAAYWDVRYSTSWDDETISAWVRDGLQAAGYEILNAEQLKTWMEARIADKKYSVVVLCKDVIPDTVTESRDANCMLRRYLDAGGKVVWYGDIPIYLQGYPNRTTAQWADGGAPAVLGLNTAGAKRDVNQMVTLTPAGASWGLTQTWQSVRPALPTAATDLEILATDNTGNAAAWAKHYVAGDTFRGFVRIWDFNIGLNTIRPTVEEIMRVAEYAGPRASSPNPANGATGVAMLIMQWVSAGQATSHQVYFGTDRAAVFAAGTTSPEYKGQQPLMQTAYIAAVPITAGTTYYWRIDEVIAGGTAVPGDVWSFTSPSEAAWGPKPANGATYVAADAGLEWMPGLMAAGHDVYFGTDRAAVEAGSAEAKKASNLPLASYTPTGLEQGKTYYWRVDEEGGVTPVTGQVWSFTVRPVIAKADPNMVGWWKLDDDNAVVAADSSGWDHHGVLMGNPQWTDGYSGSALRFDGFDDYIECGTDATFNFSGSVTIAAWVKTGSPISDCKIASNQNGSTGGYKVGIYNNVAEMEIRTAANTAVLNRPVAGGTILTPGVWYHVVGVYSLGKSITTYVNGKLDRERAITDVLGASNGTFKIGRESNAANYYWFGSMDDIRIYNRALTGEEIAEIAKGDPLLVSNRQPARDATIDVRSATELSWSAAAAAAKHDVYFGKDKTAVAAADAGSPEYKGRQAETSFVLDGLVEFGGGSYFWRVDEVEADGTTVHKGDVWQFTIPGYLIVDTFEGYTNDSPNRVFQTWIDGFGFSADEFFPKGDPGNGTGAGAGHDIWTDTSPYFQKTIMEKVFFHEGIQSMPLDFNNANAGTKYYSEAGRTWTPSQDLTVGGVTDLNLWFKGRPQKLVVNADGSLTISSTSGDISGTNGDYFRYVYKKLDGDGSMIVKVDNMNCTANWTKVGIMIRETLDVASTRAHMITLGNGRLAFENRPTTNGASGSQYSAIGAVPLPVWLKLERKGNDFTGYYSTDGTNWTANVKGASGGGGTGTNPQSIVMAGSVLIGLCVTSNNAGVTGIPVIAHISNITSTGAVTGDWTVADIGTATQPNPANNADDLYVAIQDKSGKVAVATWDDGTIQNNWTQWTIPLSQFTGVNMSAVTKIFIGVGNRDNPQPDGAGQVFIDDVRVIKP